MKKIIGILLCLCVFALMPEMVLASNLQTAKVENNVIAKEDFSEHIKVTKDSIPLNSRLKKQYAGYQYTIVSDYPNELDLIVGNVIGGINGQVAYIGVEKSSAAAIGSVLGGGLVLGIVTLGISFLCALVATPFIYFSNNNGNKKAASEGLKFSNQVPTGSFIKGDTISFTTLLPLSQQPVLKLQFRDLKTKEIYSITK